MTHADAQFDKELAAAYEELEKAQQKLAELRRRLPHEPVSDYQLQGADGPVSLSALFGEKEDLILVHNMGSGCSYCTMWADNFNGVAHHLQDRAAFALVSADSPSAQQEFARGRGWRFPIYSAAGSTFTAEMGFPEPGRRLHVRLPARRLGLPQERRRQHHARGQRPLRPGRPLLRRVAPVQSAPRRLERLGPAARLPGARLTSGNGKAALSRRRWHCNAAPSLHSINLHACPLARRGPAWQGIGDLRCMSANLLSCSLRLS